MPRACGRATSARCAGIELPVTVVETSICDREVPAHSDRLPTLRDPDLNFYLKSERARFAIAAGSAGKSRSTDSRKSPLDFGQELFSKISTAFEMIAGPAAERIPVLNEVGIRTSDQRSDSGVGRGEPVMGIAEGIENFFIACGFTAGIAASGGAGMAIGELDRIGRSRHGSLCRSICAALAGCTTGLPYLRDAAIES